jgi:predicted DNA-binding transcriptional regulator YafY
MANGKHPTFRFRIINMCFTNPRKKYWSLEEIGDALVDKDLGVAPRTLERDLETMRNDDRLGYHAPIQYCRKNKGFYYSDPEYSTEKLPLGEEEIEAFGVIVESFQRFKGAQIVDQVAGMFDKLDKVVLEQLKKKKTKVSYPVLDFEKIPYYKGMEHFDKAYQGILKQQPLLILYKKFDHEVAKEHIFHPYLLKEYKHRWYVLGYSEKRRAKLILALDRIEGITEKRIPFKPYKGIAVEKYFNHTIGVTINNNGIQDVVVWFSPSQGNYIKTQHLHATQKIVKDSTEGLVVQYQLIPNYELMQTLLAFGPEVKVLQPENLRDELKEMLKKSLSLYE